MDTQEFNSALLSWYQENKRDMPWRQTQDPYKIWVSEIMLQQTQVQTVIDYYLRFMDRFPTVKDLADADLDEVYKLWEGLGYYSRARNLHRSAQIVRDSYGGVFPTAYQNILQLKGIGSYTAGAISSIAYGIRVPAVDGNVLRVISRILGSEEDIAIPKVKRKIEAYLQETMDDTNPADFNQALMELGALICTPRNPKCGECPVPVCAARMKGLQQLLPIKSRKSSKTLVSYIAAFMRDEDGRLLLRKRPETGLLAGLYELPQIEVTELSPSAVELAITELGKHYRLEHAEITIVPQQFKHVFSHRIWETLLLRIEKVASTSNFYEDEEWGNLAISTAHLKLIKYVLENTRDNLEHK